MCRCQFHGSKMCLLWRGFSLTPTSVSHRLMTSSDTICNNQNPLLADIVLLTGFSQSFEMRLLRRDFHTLVSNVLFSSPINVGSHNPPPLRLSVLTGTPLTDIVYFSPLRVAVSFTILKCVYYREVFTPSYKMLRSLL